MSSLANLQAVLQSYLVGGEKDSAVINQLVFPAKGTVQERLSVYANAYRWRLIEALQKEYGLLSKLLGEDVFLGLAENFIDVCPSQFYSVISFTRQLPLFLLQYKPYDEKPYLSELAQLIRALSLSLEATDAPFLSHKTLMAIAEQNWSALCFKCHPSVQLLTFSWNSFFLWKALVVSEAVPSAQPQTSYCVVWRKELQSYALNLTETEAVALKTLQAGGCFADVCEVICTRSTTNEVDVASFSANLLMRWLDHSLFSEVYIP